MDIYFSPISMFATYKLAVAGNSIVVDGIEYSLSDLALLTEQGKDMPSRFIVSVTQNSVSMLLPYWGVASEAVAYPEPIIACPDGPVQFPI